MDRLQAIKIFLTIAETGSFMGDMKDESGEIVEGVKQIAILPYTRVIKCKIIKPLPIKSKRA